MGNRPGVSRMSFCSSVHRPSWIRSSSGKEERRRSVMFPKAVEAFGCAGMK